MTENSNLVLAFGASLSRTVAVRTIPVLSVLVVVVSTVKN